MPIRKPTPAELGEVVTVAIVALTQPYDRFICVSDMRISHDDIFPANDQGLVKNWAVCKNWSAAFSADKIENALPLLDRVRCQIPPKAESVSEEDLQRYFTNAISEKIKTDFRNERLARYGYSNVEQFRRDGLAELGDHFFELCRELDKTSVGVEFIVYGYDDYTMPRLFEVSGQGAIIDRMAIRYAVVGSGYYIASALLKRKPLMPLFESMLYRMLEAKFTAETAGVGRPTIVTFKSRDQHDTIMLNDEIEEIRKIWEIEMRHLEPKAALDVAAKIAIQLQKQDMEHQKTKLRGGTS